MATETISGTDLVGLRSSATATISPAEILRAILTPLSSLKLTVVLLVAATLVTWIATLDQTRFDILEVKNKHFQNVLVEVPFQTFFVPRWFPDHQNVPGSFYIPSGITILVAMLINLTAAHMLRFRLQASGMRLVFGMLAAVAAAGLTWAVVFNGQNPEGFQAEPPISWKLMWKMLQVAMLGIGISAVYGYLTMAPERKVERILMLIGAVVFLLGLGVTFWLGEKSFVGESAMRILWQLMQASIAGIAALAAAMLLFKRKAGIVVVHLGIAGLMMNEIYVTATNEEQRMMIREGQTVSSAFDIREVEFVAVDQSDSELDQIVAVPQNLLTAGQPVSDPALPFQLTCDLYYPNAEVIKALGAAENIATTGLGKTWLASPTSGGIGTDSKQQANSAAAYVTLKDPKSDEDLGTFMVSQIAWENGLVDSVTFGDKKWQIGLRFKTAYKPYSMTLKDVQAEYYLSTSTPKWFASEVVLDDRRTGTKSDQRIWMNNPLRYSDETFYQSHYDKDGDGTEVTILQVVRNKGWMIPYVCCMFTVIGLVAQFGSSLTSHLQKKRKTVEEDAVAQRTWRSSALAIGLLVIFGLYAAGQLSKAMSGKQLHNDLRLDRFGAIPISFNGRVQPLDSLARSTSRQLGNRDEVVDATGKETVTAIRWLADTVFEAPGFDQYRVFRIEDPNIRSALGLEENHDRFLYSLADLDGADRKIMGLMEESRELKPEQWSPFQKRLMGVREKLQQVMAIRAAFGNPAQRVDEDDVMNRLRLGRTIVDAQQLPLAVPNDDEERPWISFAEAINRDWLQELAEQRGSEDVSALASSIVDSEMFEPMRDEMIKSEIIQRMVSDPELLKLLQESTGATDPSELAHVMEKNWDDIPKEAYEGLEKGVAPFVDAMLAQRRPQVERPIKDRLVKLVGNEWPIKSDSNYPVIADKLEGDYRAGNAEAFNVSLENYLKAVQAKPPTGMRAGGVPLEHFYNAFAPFYLAMVIYLFAAIIAGIGWLGWTRPFQQASSWLLVLGLVIHVSGLVMRVMISGRPPVTNLYSSALFVSAAYVLLMLIVERITRIGIGNAMAGVGAYLALLWAWTMSIVDGDTFAVLVAVLDTQFWLSTHVVIVSLGYAATLVAGFLGLAYVLSGLITPVQDSPTRRLFGNVIYGTVCFGLLASFFGTVLGGLWGDDSWGRFWGWDPKENGALMIVLWNAVVLHARWGGMVKTRGLAALAILGNVVTLWSWKGVNAMGVGLHAYAGTEDTTMKWILVIAAVHLLVAVLAAIPTRFWMSHAKELSKV